MKKKETRENLGRPAELGLFHSKRDAGNSFSPPPSLLLLLLLLLSVSYTTFPFSLMQTDYVISRFIQVATTFACLFFFSPPLIFLPPFSLLYFFVAASFCFAKLIQPDSPAAFNQRDDLRFSFFFRRARVSVNFIPPRASVFVLSRPIVLCKWGGGTG